MSKRQILEKNPESEFFLKFAASYVTSHTAHISMKLLWSNIQYRISDISVETEDNMLLIELAPMVEEQLQHQRLRHETLSDAVSRIISEAYEAMLSRGDPRVP